MFFKILCNVIKTVFNDWGKLFLLFTWAPIKNLRKPEEVYRLTGGESSDKLMFQNEKLLEKLN